MTLQGVTLRHQGVGVGDWQCVATELTSLMETSSWLLTESDPAAEFLSLSSFLSFSREWTDNKGNGWGKGGGMGERQWVEF